MGYKKDLSESDNVIVAGFDAATSGRLAVSYYSEISSNDFFDRLKYWDETCCWHDNRFGTSSPSLKRIISCALGTQQGQDEISKIVVDDHILSQHIQRLLSCRINKVQFPLDIEKAIVNKASNIQIYSKQNRDKLLFTACAVIKKYIFDNKKEDWIMALEPNKLDRSYQYGRLLAILEKAEYDTYELNEKRETNAIRMQSMFLKRPSYTAKIILEQLKNSYYPKLATSSKIYYEKLIGEIMVTISDCGEENYNKPLDDTYLLGYYLQKNDLYSKKDTIKEDLINE